MRAGAASVPLRVPAGTPLAGYGSFSRRRLFPGVFAGHAHAFWFKANVGTLDPIRTRALVLEAGSTRLVWVTLETVAVDRAFRDEVRDRLPADAGKATTLIVSATHTHSGPGAFLDSWLMGMVAADRFDREVRDAMIADVVEAVQRAETRRLPARVATASVTAPPLTKSRLGQPLDSELIVMKVSADSGAPIALVWNYAIHGTMLGAINLKLSGDVMGLASNALERDLGVPALFVNGAVADVSPAGHGREAEETAGDQLASAARAAWTRLRDEARATLTARTVQVALPAPSLSVRNCLGGRAPRGLRVPLASVLPEATELTAVALGDTAWLTLPGELQTALGQKLKRAARSRWPHGFVAGLSNDYLGYFVSGADYDRPAYVTCASLYGRDGGERLTAAGIALLHSLATAVSAPSARAGR